MTGCPPGRRRPHCCPTKTDQPRRIMGLTETSPGCRPRSDPPLAGSPARHTRVTHAPPTGPAHPGGRNPSEPRYCSVGLTTSSRSPANVTSRAAACYAALRRGHYPVSSVHGKVDGLMRRQRRLRRWR
jgi:hypothetical protein